MNTQKAKGIPSQTQALINADSLKTAVIILEDSDQQVSHLRGRLERFLDEICRLKSLDSLLSGNTNNEIRELAWLTSPIASNLEAIQEELSAFFYSDGLAIGRKATGKSAIQAEVNHEN